MRHLPVALVLLSTLTAACVAEEERRPLDSVDDLGAEDGEGDPYQGDWKADAPLPVRVDHANLLPPVRDQGVRGTCQSFAMTAATEGFYGLQTHLSPENFRHDVPLAVAVIAYTLRVPGTKLVAETAWPYGQMTPPANLASLQKFEIPHLISTGRGRDKITKYLAESPKNNIAVGIMWDYDLESGGELPDPRMTTAQSLAARGTCNVRGLKDGSCGGHMVLLVGYEWRANHLFYKFKNSWGDTWGDDGYGWMAAEYLEQMGVAAYMITK